MQPKTDMIHALIHLIQLLKKFVVLKAEVHKPDINKLVNVPTSLNNLKTKVADLDVDLKKLSDVVDNQVVKKYKIQHTKDKSK